MYSKIISSDDYRNIIDVPIEGIQDFEKIRILREQFVKNGEKKNIRKLNKTLSKFQIEKLENIPAADMLKEAKAVLNSF